MQVLVTGGNGLLGRHVVPLLGARGYQVRVLTLPGEDTSWLQDQGALVVAGDVRLAESIAPAVEGVDAVIHMAGMMGLWRSLKDYQAVNVDGTQKVAQAAIGAGVSRFVQISSWTVYGMNLGHAVSEDFPLAPFEEPYAVTKAAADLLIQQMTARDALPAVIVRPGTFFGPGDLLHFARIADRVRLRRALVVGSGDNALPFVYVTDVAQGVVRALEHGVVGHAYNISHDQPVTQLELLEAIAAELDTAGPRLHIPYAVMYAAGAAAERLAAVTGSGRQPLLTRLGVKLFGTDNRHCIGRARREIGFEPEVTLREGVHRAALWYRSQLPVRLGADTKPHAVSTTPSDWPGGEA